MTTRDLIMYDENGRARWTSERSYDREPMSETIDPLGSDAGDRPFDIRDHFPYSRPGDMRPMDVTTEERTLIYARRLERAGMLTPERMAEDDH